MSRRPRTFVEEREKRALLSMAPGGLIVSESPVRRHRGQIIGNRQSGGPAPANTPPDAGQVGITVVTYGPSNSDTITVPAFPAGMTSAVVMVANTGYTDFSVPAGWTELAAGGNIGVGGTNGSPLGKWRVLTTTDPAVGRSFTGSGRTSKAYSGWGAIWGYFTGGSGGQWNVTAATELPDTSYAYPADTPNGYPFVQMIALTAPYSWVTLQGFANSGIGPDCRPACFPSGSIALADWPDPVDSSLQVDFGTLGANGTPSTASIGAYWTP